MDECLFWLTTRWTVLRLYVHAPQNVLGGIKLHSQSDDLDNTLILPFLPSFFPVPHFYSLGSPPQKNNLSSFFYDLLSQAQLSRGGPRIEKITFLCNFNKSQGPHEAQSWQEVQHTIQKTVMASQKGISVISIYKDQRESSTF